ncbi:hypothetical protein HYQ46_013065 [Verticillium longisporum]|nr:hypothetical protein HYQ44_009489 [Verticillium longisporum]KAG7151174.1 hypothetical protein HYQ46_013065 [Verticillium longisporum]
MSVYPQSSGVGTPDPGLWLFLQRPGSFPSAPSFTCNMPRRQRSSEDKYGSDSSFSPEDSIFDMDIEASVAETEITEVDPLPDADGQVDVAGLEEFVADLADADLIDIDTVHSSEYNRRIVEEVNNSDSDAQDYSPGTEILLSGFEDHWQRFCKEKEFGDPHRQLESISLGILVSFFTWRLDLQRGKGGRKIKGIKTNSALGTYWKVFRLVYERAMTVNINKSLIKYKAR